MLRLCGVLEITVNELLSGERISPANYREKAEGNMMDLMQENEENRRRMALAVISGAITMIAVCAPQFRIRAGLSPRERPAHPFERCIRGRRRNSGKTAYLRPGSHKDRA